MKYNLDTLIDEHPNVILQISGEDLRAFAHEILIGAKAIAKAIILLNFFIIPSFLSQFPSGWICAGLNE